MLIFRAISRDPAGLKAYNFPLTIPVAINPGIPEPSADIAIAILPYQISLRSNHGRIPVNPYLDIAQIELGDTQCPATSSRQFIRLGFQGAISANPEVIVGEQPFDLGNVIGKLCLTPVQFQPFDLFVRIFMVGENGMCRAREPAKQYKDKGQSADRGKQPTMLRVSAHKRIGCYSASERRVKIETPE
jgi:hypothetical protein